MAWIRWRGQTAHLMITEWVQGKSRQRYLASLGGAYAVSGSVRATIEARYPDVAIDWAGIDQALAAGPPGNAPLSPLAWDWSQVEHQLREWAATGPAVFPNERGTLLAAAAVLQAWRAREESLSQREPETTSP